jgi:hypothetical protein
MLVLLKVEHLKSKEFHENPSIGAKVIREGYTHHEERPFPGQLFVS